MGLEVKRQERENPQSLIRRCGKAVQESGSLVRARKLRFKTRKKSKDVKRKAAIRRETTRKEYEKMKKLGKLEKNKRRY